MLLIKVIDDYTNTIKNTFDFNFKSYQALNSMDIKIGVKRALITCKPVIRKKLVNNQNLNKKILFIISLKSPNYCFVIRSSK